MLARIITINCSKCKTLGCGYLQRTAKRKVVDAEKPRYSKSRRHEVEKCEDPWQCPKCGK